MILKNISDIIGVTETIWQNLPYRNTNAKSKINILINNKKLIHEFDDDIDYFVLNAIGKFDNLNSFVLFGKNKSESF